MSNHLSLTSFLSKCILGFLATLLMGTAISLFLACNLGSDPITVFLDGFHKKTGVCIDVPTYFIKYLNLEELSILIRLIVILFAQACFGLSFAWMQTFENGMNPMDAIFFRIIKNFIVNI